MNLAQLLMNASVVVFDIHCGCENLALKFLGKPMKAPVLGKGSRSMRGAKRCASIDENTQIGMSQKDETTGVTPFPTVMKQVTPCPPNRNSMEA